MAVEILYGLLFSLFVTVVSCSDFCPVSGTYIYCEYGCCNSGYRRSCCDANNWWIRLLIIGICGVVGTIITIVVVILCCRRRRNAGQVVYNPTGTTGTTVVQTTGVMQPVPGVVQYNAPNGTYPTQAGYLNYGYPQMTMTTMPATTIPPGNAPMQPPPYESVTKTPQY